MKIPAKIWWLPALIVLVLDIVTSEWIWLNGGYDFNPLYSPVQGMPPEFAIGIFTLIITHVIVFVLTLWTSLKMPKNYSGVPFLVLFSLYLYVVTNNFMVILWGVNLPWI